MFRLLFASQTQWDAVNGIRNRISFRVLFFHLLYRLANTRSVIREHELLFLSNAIQSDNRRKMSEYASGAH